MSSGRVSDLRRTKLARNVVSLAIYFIKSGSAHVKSMILFSAIGRVMTQGYFSILVLPEQ